MTKDIESQEQEIEAKLQEAAEKYKAEVLEISKLCKLAKAENKIANFIMAGLNPDQVKEQLLAMQAQSESKEIVSTIYQKNEQKENPVVAAAKARIR